MEIHENMFKAVLYVLCYVLYKGHSEGTKSHYIAKYMKMTVSG